MGFLSNSRELSILEKLPMLSWGFIFLVVAIAGCGVLLLYSAGGGAWEPWAAKHAIRFGILSLLMIAIAVIDLRFWLRMAYPIYGVTLVLLVAVEIMGQTGMGAQRWIALPGGFVIQPSELMKIALTLALARFFHSVPPEHIRSPLTLIIPLILIALPVGLVLLQPNLGTALLLLLASAMIFWESPFGCLRWRQQAGRQ
jgi:rod shape determining protein RodA